MSNAKIVEAVRAAHARRVAEVYPAPADPNAARRDARLAALRAEWGSDARVAAFLLARVSACAQDVAYHASQAEGLLKADPSAEGGRAAFRPAALSGRLVGDLREDIDLAMRLILKEIF